MSPPPDPAQAFHDSIVSEFDLSDAELLVLAQVVATWRLIDRLAAELADSPVMVPAQGGVMKLHPAAAEVRQQRVALARLVAALGIPVEHDDDGTPRVARRHGHRGVYRPSSS